MDGDRLTDEETALVLRRAAELDHQADPDSGGLDPTTLEEVAVEAGLSRQSVRRALAELRLGALADPPATRRASATRLYGPGTFVVSRAVAASAAAVEGWVREYLEAQLFRVVRDVDGRSLWSPREDLKASVQRSIDRKVQRRLVLGDVRRVHVAVGAEPGPGTRSLVHLEVDVGQVRRTSTSMAAAGGAVGVTAVGASLVLVGLDPVTAAALPVGGAAALAGHRMGVAHYRNRAGAVATALEGMLDGLERRAAAGGRRDPGGGRPR